MVALCLKFLLFSTFLLLSSIPFSFSSASAHTSGELHGVDDDDGNSNSSGMVLGLSSRTERERLLADTSSEQDLFNSTLLLASKRTYRNPLNHFHKYSGGWNISNRHYWASVAYTAVPFFVIGALWFLIFGFALTLICLCYCCCPREPYGYSRIAYALSLILLTLFTIAAIVGCIVLYTGQAKFHSSTTSTLDYVVSQADTTSENLRNVSGYLSAAKQINVDQVILLLMRLALIILSAVMLLLTFLGFVFSIFGMQVFVYILVVAGWILVTGTFLLCGIFLLLHNVTGDTCVAMDQWVQHPTAHTALDDILPCVDNATAQETLTKSKEVTSQLVNLMNTVITNISNNNFAPNMGPFYYNQSGPRVPNLCNPFNADLSDRACAPGEVELNNATQVWRGYVCETSGSGICATTGRLTPGIYGQMAAGVNVSYGLYRYGPFLWAGDGSYSSNGVSGVLGDIWTREEAPRVYKRAHTESIISLFLDSGTCSPFQLPKAERIRHRRSPHVQAVGRVGNGVIPSTATETVFMQSTPKRTWMGSGGAQAGPLGNIVGGSPLKDGVARGRCSDGATGRNGSGDRETNGRGGRRGESAWRVTRVGEAERRWSKKACE
ncbi:UNVERIFIED_CONTAM: hypothetical protein Slati_4396100 [Sesamum latifolium]|uniref:Transmembrane protein n=1 Tax=Sesamum latifolium TaxID=2727402 RepID=A0AAW2SPD8_9LAMI